MTRRAASSFVCVLFLLFAQFGALTHAVWHASGHAHAQDHVDGGAAHDDEHAPGQANLCAYDLAFGQVLGGVHAGCAPLLIVATGSESVLDSPASDRHAQTLTPKSRGPPTLL